MKRKKLIKHLNNHDCEFVREGSKHTIFQKPGTDLITSVPRHKEIEANLVRKICRDLEIPPPTEK